MTNEFKILTNHKISNNAKVNRRTASRVANLKLTDSAILAMTDLSETSPFSIEATASIVAANDKMITCGVRLLFVTEEKGDLVGLITASDILGEKPVQYIKHHGGTREEIIVKDIMTGKDALEALHLNELTIASVGDIVETMKMCHRQHMLVVKQDEQTGIETVCGIYSCTQIGRQLGIAIEPSPRVDSFAELEKVLLSA